MLLNQPAISLPPRANESPLQKMPKIEGKSEEKEKQQKEEKRTQQYRKGNNTIKSKPCFMKIKELAKVTGGRI